MILLFLRLPASTRDTWDCENPVIFSTFFKGMPHFCRSSLTIDLLRAKACNETFHIKVHYL